MKDFVSKLTLYDILAMVLPGWVLINEVAYLICGSVAITLGNETMFLIASYAVGFILHTTAERRWEDKDLRNKTEDICNSFSKDYVKNPDAKNQLKEITLNNAKQQYYIAYDKLYKNNDTKKVIKTLERQIAFGRSMVLPLGFSILDIIAYYLNTCICVSDICVPKAIVAGVFGVITIGVIVALQILLLKALPQKQRNIYRYVFENYEFV